jgi:hypothetical protein
MAFKHKLSIRSGATFRQRFTWTDDAGPVDLTGWHALAQIRAQVGDAEALATLSTDDGGITLGTAGEIDLYLPHAVTGAMAWTSGVWDLSLLSPDGDRHPPLIEGAVSVRAMVTRWP